MFQPLNFFNTFYQRFTRPLVSSANTASTTTVTIVFDTTMTVVTIAGWSFYVNGSPITLTSVSGATTTWTFVVGAMAYGDTITYSYDSNTGITRSADGFLGDISNQPVTNNIAPPVTFGIGETISSWYGIDGNGVNQVTTPDIDTSDDSFIMIGIVQIQSGVFDVRDSYSNTWVQAGMAVHPNFYIMWYKSTTFIRGANHNFTVEQNSSFASVFVVEIIGNQPSVDIDSNGNVDSSAPFQSDSIATTVADTILLSLASCDDGTSLPYTISWASGFTMLLSYDRTDGLQGSIAYKTVSSTGNYNSEASGVPGVTTFGFLIAAIKNN